MSNANLEETSSNDVRAGTARVRRFWLAVWIGTAAAGSIFGCIVAPPIGLVFGVIFAGVPAILFVGSAAAATWALGLAPLRLVMALIAGGATGGLTTGSLDVFEPWQVWLATVLGAAGASIAGAWVIIRQHGIIPQGTRHSAIRLTWRGALARLGTLAALAAAWCLVVAAVLDLQDRGRRATCENKLRLLGICLENYAATHAGLLPKDIGSPAGKDLLSWRVVMAVYWWYSLGEWVRLSEAWDSPTNQEAWQRPVTQDYRCPAVRAAPRGIGQYLAVVGPGTLWSTGRMPTTEEAKRQILIIDWPTSDVVWGEPRDVSAEEILNWLSSRPGRGSTPHRGRLLYLDGAGRVGQLRTEADPEEARRLLTGPGKS